MPLCKEIITCSKLKMQWTWMHSRFRRVSHRTWFLKSWACDIASKLDCDKSTQEHNIVRSRVRLISDLQCGAIAWEGHVASALKVYWKSTGAYDVAFGWEGGLGNDMGSARKREIIGKHVWKYSLTLDGWNGCYTTVTQNLMTWAFFCLACIRLSIRIFAELNAFKPCRVYLSCTQKARHLWQLFCSYP